jgi:hypothetical protein
MRAIKDSSSLQNDNNSCSYTISYNECDSSETNAWISLYKAKKGEFERSGIINY